MNDSSNEVTSSPEGAGDYSGPARLGMRFSHAQAPDKSWWVSVTILTGPASFTFGIPVDGADSTAEAIAAEIKREAKEARLKRSGLTVASASDVHAQRRNGHYGRRNR